MLEQTQPAGMNVVKLTFMCVDCIRHLPRFNIYSVIITYRDNKGQTPYIVAPDKDTRNVFRKYMGENPDKYDYRRAQV